VSSKNDPHHRLTSLFTQCADTWTMWSYWCDAV